jgi:hypothetical protein
VDRSQQTIPEAPGDKGLLARLATFGPRLGIGVPSKRARVLISISATLLLAALLVPSFAQASCPTLEFNTHPLEASPVFATRAELSAAIGVDIAEAAGGFEEWRIEYTTEPANPGSWLLAASGTAPGGNYSALIRHLAPSTHYFARTSARTPSCGELKSETDFTTTPVSPPEFFFSQFGASVSTEVGVRSAKIKFAPLAGDIEANGADTSYHFEYATSQQAVESGSGTLIAATPPGPISVAEEFATPEVQLSGLSPETTYYLRGVAENEIGSTAKIVKFTTVTAKPRVTECVICTQPTNITGTSVTLHDAVNPDGSETAWRFEYAPAEPNGSAPAEGSPSWAAGPAAVIAASEADEEFHEIAADLTGLSPASVYYLRFIAENEAGTGVTVGSLGPPRVTSLETAGPPLASAFATHTFAPGASEALRILASVTPDDTPISEVQTLAIGGAPTGGTFTLSFQGQTTAPIPFDASERELGKALQALPSLSASTAGRIISGPHGGPYRIEFAGSLGGIDQPQLTCDASALTPSGACTVTTIQNGSSPQTKYHLEYIEQGKFEREGWSAAESTPPLDAGPGGTSIETEPAPNFESRPKRIVFTSTPTAADLPLLEPGNTYRYRMLAENPYGTVTGEDRTLTVPIIPAPASESCPNQALRTGPSIHLPDCRAYEQVTPVDKEGATEIFKYGTATLSATQVAEDGERFLFYDDLVKWGTNTGPQHTGYLFSRRPESDWQMSSTTPQPAAGVNDYVIGLQSPDLTQVALEVGWKNNVNQSTEVTLLSGPLGGPYDTVATIPRTQVPDPGANANFGAWLAASADFSRLVFESTARKLAGHQTGTASGYDLYEYSGGQLRQANVDSAGHTIGSCGARVVHGYEGFAGGHGPANNAHASPHALSADGSRLFFEAVPGSNCSEPTHLYMRTAGAETTDLGTYTFLAANPAATKLLLEHTAAGAHEVLLYDTAAQELRHLFTTQAALSEHGQFASADLTDFYFTSEEVLTPEAPAGTGHLYRYDIPAEALRLALPAGAPDSFGNSNAKSPAVSPDGRYFYFPAQGIAGVPGGRESQVYRYDSVEELVQCISCASPFNPEPSLFSTFMGVEAGTGNSVNGTPDPTLASANGDYVFFDTPSALLSSDIDGELNPGAEGPAGFASSEFSPSSDLYEWRKPGVDGCSHAQGCLSLISSGQGGFKVMPLGTTPSGRDVFFTTTSRLAPTDQDSALDVYDARIGGGLPTQTFPVECEGDACHHPATPPAEPTLSTSVPSGPGNQHPRKHRKRHHRTHHKAKRHHKRAGSHRGGGK